ncbi:MAG: DoxX family membrane protein [Planctomycetota bacterium]
MNTRFDAIDRAIASTMMRWGQPALRYSLAIVFVWFGLLKPLGLSPAENLVRETVSWMPLFTPAVWVKIIGWWEVAIGLLFLWNYTTRIAIALLAGQMIGTFLPLIVLPEVAFQSDGFPFALTMEGQYIVKNLLIISAALVIGGRVRETAASKP